MRPRGKRHDWRCYGEWKLTAAQARDMHNPDPNVNVDLNMSNVGNVYAACHTCETLWNPETAATRCPGEPKDKK